MVTPVESIIYAPLFSLTWMEIMISFKKVSFGTKYTTPATVPPSTPFCHRGAATMIDSSPVILLIVGLEIDVTPCIAV